MNGCLPLCCRTGAPSPSLVMGACVAVPEDRTATQGRGRLYRDFGLCLRIVTLPYIIQSALQYCPTFKYSYTHLYCTQMAVSTMQGNNQLVGSSWGQVGV